MRVAWGDDVHLLLVGASHRTAPVELRERLDFCSRGLEQAVRALARRDRRQQKPSSSRPAIAPSCTSPARIRRRATDDLLALLLRVPSAAGRSRAAASLLAHRSRRRAAPVSRLLRPRFAGRRRAADSRADQGGVRRRGDGRRAPARCSTSCSTGRSASASACARRRRWPKARCRSASRRSASRKKIFGNLTGRRVLVDRRRRDGQAHRAAPQGARRGVDRDHQPHAGARAGAGRRSRRRRGAVGLAAAVARSTPTSSSRSRARRRRFCRRRRSRRRCRPAARGRCFSSTSRCRATSIRSAGEIEQVFLYNIDDLQAIVRENLEQRGAEVGRAEQIVEEEVQKFATWQRSREAVPTIVALRQRFETIRKSELERLEPKLAAPAAGGARARRRGYAAASSRSCCCSRPSN